MKSDTSIKYPNEIKNEKDALEQSIALNRIVMTMLQHQKESNKRMFIALIASLCINVIIVAGFLWYESQWTYSDTITTTTTSTITQDSGEGGGNNIHQEGENAVYNQGAGKEMTE